MFLRSSMFVLLMSVLGSSSRAGDWMQHAELISKPANGQPSNAGSYDFDISANGRYLVFVSTGNDIVAGVDTKGVRQIFWFDRETGETRLMSRTGSGVPANGDSESPCVSDDGKRVAFLTEAINLGATNGKLQVVYVDAETGENRIVSKTWNGGLAETDCKELDLAGNGNALVFVTDAKALVGIFAPIRHIEFFDAVKDELYLITFNNTGEWANGDSYYPRISRDGRYVAFDTTATNLPDSDSDDGFQIMVHDVKTGATERVSQTKSGQSAISASFGTAISDNGRYVAFFSSSINLFPSLKLPEGEMGLFVKDRKTGKLRALLADFDASIDEYPFEYTRSFFVSDDGRRVAVLSHYDSPVLPNTGGRRAHFYDLVKGTHAIVQPTKPENAASGFDSIGQVILKKNGKRMFFESASPKLLDGTSTFSQLFQLETKFAKGLGAP